MASMGFDEFATLDSGYRLCYRTAGDPLGDPVVLIAGLAQQLHAWPRWLIEGLVAEGHFVVAFDNRDTGQSSRVNAPAPSKLRLLLGMPRSDAYTLSEMAGDVVALLNHLKLDRAHLVGQSMGGMIGQTVAALAPESVRSLTSLYSTTGDMKVGQATWSTKLRLAAPAAKTAEQSVRNHLALMAHLAGRDFPIDEAFERAYAEEAWARGGGANTDGMARQIQAIMASGDRTQMLARVKAPTVVINGDRDLIVDPSGGKATAAAIKDARHVVIRGMGHHLAAGLERRVLQAIRENAVQRA